jgi:hypothetical protein
MSCAQEIKRQEEMQIESPNPDSPGALIDLFIRMIHFVSHH